MKRKLAVLLLSGIMVFSLAACGGNDSSQKEEENTQTSEDLETADNGNSEEGSSEEAGDTAKASDTAGQTDGAGTFGGNVLIAYFSVPEDINTSGIDADAGASVVVKDGEKLGNVQYMAQTIQSAVGGDLFRIETAEEYPLDHDPLVDQAADEQDENARPELSTHIENPDQYDTILLGYPNWWGDMPQVLYSFFDEYDFAEKTIVPFNVHNGSRFSGTIETIQELEPDAEVVTDGFTISEKDVPDAEGEVTDWLSGLGY